MDQDILKKTLAGVDLNEKEITLYMSVLELKESAIVPVAKHANLPRTSAQYILEQLAHRGLISIGEKNNRKTYRPNPPERVLAVLKKKQNDLSAQSSAFQEVMPDLMQLYQTSPFQPRVQLYHGHGIREVYEQIIESGIEEYCYVSETTTLAQLLGRRYFNDWIKRRIAKGIWANGVRVRASEVDDRLHTSSEANLRRLRFAPDGYSFPAMIVVYGDTVAIVTSAQENFAVVITSPDYATTMRTWFQALWEQSAPPKLDISEHNKNTPSGAS